MKVYEAPKVILVARPSLVMEGVGELLLEYGESPVRGWDRGGKARDLSDGDGLCELMGRLCYGSFGKRQGRVGAVDYFDNVLSGGHGSVLEHAVWSFVVCRASRGYTHQQVRHRAGWAYSQESQHFIRYASEGEPGSMEAAVCVTGAPGLPGDWTVANKMVSDAESAVENYAELWKLIRETFPEDAKRVKKEVSGVARGDLPTSLESRIGITANARALRHFCELRGALDNVPEVRLVALQIAVIMFKEAPAMFQDVHVEGLGTKDAFISSKWRKV